MKALTWASLWHLGLGLAVIWGYLVFLAVLVQRTRVLQPTHAALLLALSFPLRFLVLGVTLAWIVRAHGLTAVAVVVVALVVGRVVIYRRAQDWGR